MYRPIAPRCKKKPSVKTKSPVAAVTAQNRMGPGVKKRWRKALVSESDLGIFILTLVQSSLGSDDAPFSLGTTARHLEVRSLNTQFLNRSSIESIDRT